MIDLPGDTLFGPANLPYGVFSTPSRGDGRRRVGVALGDQVLDVAPLLDGTDLAPLLVAPVLNPLLAAGRRTWCELRARLTDRVTGPPDALAPHLVPLAEVALHLPIDVGDYVDFYANEHHAANVGRIFRPGSEPLTPELEAPADRLPRPQRDHRRVRHRRRAPARSASRRRSRRGAGVRAVDPAGHRGRGRVRRRRRNGHGRVDRGRRRRRARVRGVPAQRLVRPRRPGLGVRAAGSVPGQVVRHLGLAVGGAARRARGGAGAPAAARPRATALPARRRRPRAGPRHGGGPQRPRRLPAAVRGDVLDRGAAARAHDRERRVDPSR